MSNCAEVFGEIYRTGVWGSGSGGGSNPIAMRPYIDLVSSLALHHHAVLDIGCGDGLIASAINWGSAKYTGVDGVPEMVAKCKALYLNAHVLDALVDQLPAADLVLIKEVTQHLPNAMVAQILERLRCYPAVLHTSCVDKHTNLDIELGQTRGVDLRLPPFELPAQTLLEFEAGGTRYMSQMWRPA